MRFFLVLVLTAFGLSGEAKAQDANGFSEAELAVLWDIKQNTWPRLYREGDVEALDRFLADDFIILMPSGGVSTKADELAALARSGGEGPEDFVFTISQIVRAGADVAIIFGHGDSTRTGAGGQPCRHRYWSSNTLRREAGEWRAVMSHISGVSCEPL